MAPPFVSVVVPVFNGEATLEACLRALTAQDYPAERYEVLVVDNGSTDGTARIAARFPVRCVPETSRRGSYAARNRGLAEAKGEIIAFTDADCVPAPDWLRRGAEPFADAKVGGVAGAVVPLDPRTLAQRYAAATHALSQETALTENAFLPAVYTANAFYRASALAQIGGFDASVKSGGDADLAWRVQLQLHLAIAYCPGAVVRHEHRARVGELLRQRRLYGYGSVVNYVKYRDRTGPRTLKHAYWELASLGRKTARFAVAGVGWLASLGRSAERAERAALAGLDVLVFFAKKAGQLRAALDHRTWYF